MSHPNISSPKTSNHSETAPQRVVGYHLSRGWSEVVPSSGNVPLRRYDFPMSDEDPGDLFLRNSDAVLDAVLSDPRLFASRASDDAAPEPELDEPVSPEVTAAFPTTARPGPKASERINALLSGDGGGSGSMGGDLASFMEMRERPDTADVPPPQPHAPQGGRTRRDDFIARAEAVSPRLAALLQRRKLLILIGCNVLALLIVLIIATSGNGSSPSQPVITQSQAAAAQPSPSGQSGDHQLKVKSATSSCPPGSTSAMDAFVGEAKAWDCVRGYHIDGQVMTIDLGGTFTIDSIGMVPGWNHTDADGTDQWERHRLATRVSYEFDDANQTTYTQQTADRRSKVVTKMDPPVTASTITLTILKSTGPDTINDTAISSVAIMGH